MNRAQMLKRYRISNGDKFRLKDIDPADTLDLDLSKKEAKEVLSDQVKVISKLQEMLYAQDRWSVLIVLQAMDAAGKDSVLEHVMSGINPAGCQVHSFKAPTTTELDHDFLWRTTCALPERGRIGVFNRSYYEEVLVVRVRPQILGGQRLPKKLVTENIWQERYEDIRNFEKYLARNGTLILKFFLHVSKEEQKKRFLDRIDEPDKRWKFNPSDIGDRMFWDRYMEVYEDAIKNTSADHAPWFVVPADNKWFTRLVVANAIADAMEKLGLEYPKIDAAALDAMMKSRKELENDK